MADPAREWWQQPLYIELESPRTYVDLVAPDPAPVVEPFTLTDVAPAQATVDSGNFDVTFTGSGFDSRAQYLYANATTATGGGVGGPATVQSDTQATATLFGPGVGNDGLGEAYLSTGSEASNHLPFTWLPPAP